MMGKKSSPTKKIVFLALTLLTILLIGATDCVKFASAATSVYLTSPAQTETTITLSWSRSDDIVFTKYELYFSSVGVNGPYSLRWSTTEKDTLSTFVSGLSPNTNYWFYIQDSGWLVGSTPSNYLQKATKPNPALILTAETTTTISLSWTDYNTYSSLVPFGSYSVQMSTSGESGPWSNLITITNPSQTTYTATGLSPGQTYYFRMYDSVGTSGNIQSFSNVLNLSAISQLVASASAPTSTINRGQTVQLSASSTGGTPPYNYQWFSNGNPVSGATSTSYSFSPQTAGSYNFYVSVHDSANGQANSNTISITVNPDLSASISASQTTINAGQTVQFSGSASGGTAPYSYQWFLDSGSISQATSSSYSFSTNVAGVYSISVSVQDSLGAQTRSNPITIIVNSPMSVIISRSSATIDLGQSVQLTCDSVSGGTPPYSYQWFSNGNQLSTATSASYSLSPSSTGTYDIYLSVHDSLNTQVDSNTIEVAVNPQPTASINCAKTTIDKGQEAQLSATANGGTPPYSYQWFSNDAPISGATASNLNFNIDSTGTFKIYASIQDSLNVKVYSNSMDVIVNSPPSANAEVTPLSSSILFSNDRATLTVSATGGSGSYKYDWYLNGNFVESTTSPSYTHIFKTMGEQRLQARITDEAGYTVDSNIATVTYSYNYLLIGAIVVTVVIVAVGVVIGLRRRSKKQKPL